ncbi:MAG: hypothetical protein ACR2M1_02100 [Gemmatimonadaceae bacterium]
MPALDHRGSQLFIVLIRRVVIAAVVVLCAVTNGAGAQTQQTQQARKTQQAARYPAVIARLDLISDNPTALQAGLGLMLPLDREFSLGGTIGAGASSGGFSGRGDLFGRFSLDPYHQNAWEPYVGGGVTVRVDSGPGTRARGYLLGFVGANGPRAGFVLPGVELGLGGGVRIGVTLRRATK